ncbi:unnamed protein product [Cylindrotheca closterium]|uniref:Uncharacterized protein n=1 Tax=Cylindrotheca closterium TaxID=2856 RepID=A0AAD2CJW7_9STRA|nr:unnamed protein product [Cylindrotheca closterium]
MSIWKNSRHRKQHSDESSSTSTARYFFTPSKKIRLILFLASVGVLLFTVELQRKLFQTALNDENTQSWWSLSFVTPSAVYYPSSAAAAVFGKGYPNRRQKLSSSSSLLLTNESWNEWEHKFRANHTMLLEQLQKSSVYGSTYDDDHDHDGIVDVKCSVDYLRDYVQVTRPATDLSPLPNDCDWPKRLKQQQQQQQQWKNGNSQSPVPVLLSDATIDATIDADSNDNKCQLVHFSATQACQLLNERRAAVNHDHTKNHGQQPQQQQPIVLLFIGDSLIRHIVIGLGIVLTGNVRQGGVQYIHSNPHDDLGHVWKRACSCENQFTCATLKQQDDMGRFTHAFGYNNMTYLNHVDWCQKSNNIGIDTRQHPPRTYQIILEQQNNNPKISPMVRQLIANHAKYHSAFVIVTDASALHSGLNIRKTRRFLDKLENLLRLQSSSRSSWLIIPMTVHHVGANKPNEFLEQQGRQPVEDYNQQLRTWVEQKKTNYRLLDTYSMTQGLPSNDGTHYPSASVALAQILLLYLRDYLPATVVRDGGAAAVQEE